MRATPPLQNLSRLCLLAISAWTMMLLNRSLITAAHPLFAVLSFSPTIELVSVDSNTTQANGGNYNPSVSSNGQFVAFESDATNLITGDNNGFPDIFLRDRTTGLTTRVSVASDGRQANGGSYNPSMSSDGQYIAFWSGATTLILSDTNGVPDIFLRDRATSQTTRISVASDGTEANGSSGYPRISSDGRYIAFESAATNLVPDGNDTTDIYLHDRITGQTTRVSVASGGGEADGGSYAPSISSNGRYIAFESDATNLVTDTNGSTDIFVRDRISGQTTRASVTSLGAEAHGSSYAPNISNDGRYIAFYSDAPDLVPGDTNNSSDIFVRDRTTGQTTRVSIASGGTQANDNSYNPRISSDGRYVTFWSYANNLVAGDTNNKPDIFVHDQVTHRTIRINVAFDGLEANDNSFYPAISAYGRFVVFQSDASNLISEDANPNADIFLHDVPLACPDYQIPPGVGAEDIQATSLRWRQTTANGSSDFDLDGDGKITVADIMRVALVQGPCP